MEGAGEEVVEDDDDDAYDDDDYDKDDDEHQEEQTISATFKAVPAGNDSREPVDTVAGPFKAGEGLTHQSSSRHRYRHRRRRPSLEKRDTSRRG
ncbi:unnamed protein product [Ectocarpus sp. 12 AP-2014]